MVRTFDYTVPSERALKEAQIVLESLGYEVVAYDAVDRYFLTELSVISRLLRPIYYVVFVSAQDRLNVIVYSEVRTFRRASRVAFAAGAEQIMQDASNNLSLRFQSAIFDPITEAIEQKGFAKWDRLEGDRAEDLAIRTAEELRLKALSAKRERERAEALKQRQERLSAYSTNQDHQRLLAVREGEHQIQFWSEYPNRSIVSLSRNLHGHLSTFESVFRRVLTPHRDVRGRGAMLWIVGPQGRVVDLKVVMKTSFNTPESELRDRLSSTLRSVFFGAGKEYLRMRQAFSFDGNYHNLKVNFDRPVMTGTFSEYPVPERDVLSDTLFVEWPASDPPVILKN